MTNNNPTPETNPGSNPDTNPGKTPTEVPGDNHEQGHSISDPVNLPGQQQGSGDKRRQQGGQPQANAGVNEGEGNKTAARHYNEAAQQSAQNPGRTERKADEAKRAIDSPEGAELERAEEIGRKPARH
ncbi:MAG: hypothetical protein IPK59_21870 [Rhodospirillaceae bacterium]|nr:hypothetical protein [Rhodospirillaceae bacterium]